MFNLHKETYSVTIERDEETDRVLTQLWRMNGRLQNSAGPAVVRYDLDTGNVVEERWMWNDLTSRLETEGPALLQYDPKTGVAVRELYFADGVLHRAFGPALILRDAATGRIVSESHYRFGKPLFSDQPPFTL